MPDRLPTKFCKPVQRPAAYGPARVCVIAHMFEELMLWKPTPNIRNAMLSDGVLMAHRSNKTPAPPSPPATWSCGHESQLHPHESGDQKPTL